MLDGVFTEVNDRYLNAALNIRNHAVSYTGSGRCSQSLWIRGLWLECGKTPKSETSLDEAGFALRQVGLGND